MGRRRIASPRLKPNIAFSRPAMTLPSVTQRWPSARNDAVAVEVVERDEFLGDVVMVRGHVAAEDAEVRVAIGVGEIAEKLVVGAVLLDDVNHVIKDRWLADALGDGDGFFAGLRAFPGAESFGDAGVGERVRGVVGELIVRGDADATDDAERPGYGPFVTVLAIESRPESFHVRDVEPIACRRPPRPETRRWE